MTVSCAEVLRSVIRDRESTRRSVDDEQLIQAHVDFEDAQPTDVERETYYLTVALLDKAKLILNEFAAYGNGATEAVQAAYRNPNDVEQQQKTWSTVQVHVRKLKDYYDFSLRLGRSLLLLSKTVVVAAQAMPELLWDLCGGPVPALEQLQSRQALTKQFAHIIDFAMQFDEIKFFTPASQNDFAYYRRVLSINSAIAQHSEQLISWELANTFSFFYAEQHPMFMSLCKAIQAFVDDHSATLPRDNVTSMLAVMANLCRVMVNIPSVKCPFRERGTVMFCLRVMTGSIILFDHIDPEGAFVKCSPIDIRAAAQTLHAHTERTTAYNKNETSKENAMSVDSVSPYVSDSQARIKCLLGALCYATKHYNDPRTPKSMKALIEG